MTPALPEKRGISFCCNSFRQIRHSSSGGTIQKESFPRPPFPWILQRKVLLTKIRDADCHAQDYSLAYIKVLLTRLRDMDYHAQDYSLAYIHKSKIKKKKE